MITQIDPSSPELRVRLAMKFSEFLRRDLGTATVLKICERNDADEIPGICHSHDFCDANMIMHEAMTVVLGDEPDVGGDCQNIVNLWNDAWQMAYNNSYSRGR